MRLTIAATLVALGVAVLTPVPAAAQSAHARYTATLARERAVRDAGTKRTLKEIRAVIAAYEQFARRYRSSGYSDNALWQAANLAVLAHDQFGRALDRRTAVRLLRQLKIEYPTSSLVPRAQETLVRLESLPVPSLPPGRKVAAPHPVAEQPATAVVPAANAGVVAIREIKRTPLPDGMRVTIEMDREAVYRHERLDGPPRVFFDVRSARPVAGLLDATLRFSDDVVRVIRLGRHPQNTTRVVMDMHGVESYSVFTLYDPFRLVVDFRRAGVAAPGVPAIVETEARLKPDTTGNAAPEAGSDPARPDSGRVRLQPDTASVQPDIATAPPETASVQPDAPGPQPELPGAEPRPAPVVEKLPIASRPVTPPPAASPSLPRANSDGRFSLARQLGLGISRVVIDAGHGGHDPGAKSNNITEAELVLDVALRLRKLLEKQTAIEVSMTRDRDVFVPLEERTAFANREGADLFLSIHANASLNTHARGVETYFLNFATNPEAEAVAARENAASARKMHNLPDIVRAIALNNKIDESRDFAAMVQRSMVRRLAARNRQIKDLGVKQAPFVVLIGAGMPSVLAEISFITNKQEAQLLKTSAYRQQIAEALLDAVMRYQESLKTARKVASRRP